MTNLEAALKYAERGWKVFPCNVDKTPKVSEGFYRASKDPEQIKTWWGEWPDASIGAPCGKDNGFWVLDIDLPEGPSNLSRIEKYNGRIPDTLAQKTGGNGVQYFWKWNGKEIRNSSSKIAKNIDVRGEGGYIILPPSNHPSGNSYRWLTKNPMIESPEWITLLIETAKNEPAIRGESQYGQKALAGEIINVSGASNGERNTTLNNSALALGGLIAGGELDQSTVEGALLGAAMAVGLGFKEATATIHSGIEAGKKNPRSNPYRNDYVIDIPEEGNQSNQSNQNPEQSTKVSTGNQEVIKSNQEVINGNQNEGQNTPYNLAAHIKEWITNSTGSFTVDQIDREFCLTSRKDKMNRAKILSIYKDKIIKKDKTIKGKWHVIDSKVDWVDLNAAEEAAFPIVLPFKLHEKISIPKRAIIVLAGSTNAGKTAFILNTLRLNITQDYTKVYLMSEMADGEYKDRIIGFNDPISLWNENIKAASKSYDFNDVIENHNPDGLTCIDYLEEVDGEYFKIPSNIRDIYDALNNGVAMVAIQKKTGADVGRGGEATKDKARLYMTLDYLCTVEHGIICAIKLAKVKKSIGKNMQDMELHFKIERGSNLSVIMDWTHSSKIIRHDCIMQYQMSNDSQEFIYEPYAFKTIEGDEVFLEKKDYLEWKRIYKRYDIDKELKRVSGMSYSFAWLNKKNWYWQLGNHLDKKSKEK